MVLKGEPCTKCGYISEKNKKKLGLSLCTVCFTFSPNNPERLDEYISQKIDWKILNSFRKNANFFGDKQKQGMIVKAQNGNIMSRAPFGYKVENNNLTISEGSKIVLNLFEEFLNSNLSLNQLSKKYGFSVNGIKKILFNFTYIGKIKFNKEISEGKHQPIISSTLFNHVQDKLEKLKIKNPNN
jgi:hypothetical protein